MMTSDVGERHFLAFGSAAEERELWGHTLGVAAGFGSPRNGLRVNRTESAATSETEKTDRSRPAEPLRAFHSKTACVKQWDRKTPPWGPGCSEGGIPTLTLRRPRTWQDCLCRKGISQPEEAKLFLLYSSATPLCPPVLLKALPQIHLEGGKWMLEHF